MDTQFNLLTVPHTGAIYKAAYNAYYNLASAAFEESSKDSSDADLTPTLTAAQAKMKAKQLQ